MTVCIGVYLSLKDVSYMNNSNIPITEIGRTVEGEALLCFTDLIQCCRDSDTPIGVSGVLGQWLYPNGSAVGTESDGEDFYIDRGPSVVRLHLRINITSLIGQFCCEVPDATSVNAITCVNIGEHRYEYLLSVQSHSLLPYTVSPSTAPPPTDSEFPTESEFHLMVTVCS